MRSGIGIVNAIEVVNAYPDFESLKKFKEWMKSPDVRLLEEVEAHATGQKMKQKQKSELSGKEDSLDISDIHSRQRIFEEKHVSCSSSLLVLSYQPPPFT